MGTAGRQLVVVLVAAGGLLCASPARAQSLGDALAAAYQSNPTLEAARAALRGKDELLPQAKADLWRPKVTFNGQAERSIADTTETFSNDAGGVTFTPNNRSSDLTFGLQALLNLYRGGQTLDQIRYAKAVIEAQRASLADTEEQVFSNVAQAYAEIVLFQAQRDIAADNEGNLQRLKDEVDHFYSVQRATITSVAQVDAELAAARTARELAVGNLQAAQSQYNSLVGSFPTSIKDWPALPPVPDALAEAQAITVAGNPRIAAAAATLRANEASLASAGDAFLPTVDLTTSYVHDVDLARYSHQATFDAFQSDYRGSIRSDTVVLGVKLSMPLYQGGLRHAQHRQQIEAVGQARSELEAAHRMAIDAAVSNWRQLEAARSREESSAAQLRSAQTAYDGVLREFQDGRSTVFDVLQQRQKLNDARASVEQARYDETVATAKLLAAMGRFNAKSLALPVKLYDPLAHFEAVEGKVWR